MQPARLAIHGGIPTLEPPPVARVEYSDDAKRCVNDAVSAGVLNQFYGGVEVRRFESAYAERFGRYRAVSANSGTSALHLMYAACDLPAGCEVLVPVNAYVSAVSALLQCGVVPVLVDIDPLTWSMDSTDLTRKVTERTLALVAVHMYGQPCPMGEIMEFSRRHDLLVLEDCGQSHGARWQGQLTGTFGEAAAYSVCCRKHISIGEGGVVTTDDKALADRMRSLAHKGKGSGFFDYFEPGFSYGLTELQAILGLDQLRSFENELEKRQKHASILTSSLDGSDIASAVIRTGDLHAFFKFLILLPERLSRRRDEFLQALKAEGVIADPAHPALTHVAWLPGRGHRLLRDLAADVFPDYSVDSCPVASDLLPRSVTIEVGHSLSVATIELFATALQKIIGHFEKA